MNQTHAGTAPPLCRADLLTVCGLALLLMPLLTMAHELGGHATACLVTQGKLTAIGTFYIECDSATLPVKRAVALAGPVMDALLAVLFYLLWRAMRTDGARLTLWYCWLVCGFEAAGYLLFSGVLGLGDLGPYGDGGLAPLQHPSLWQTAMVVNGLIAYVALVRAGQRTLTAMIGQGLATRNTRRTIAHGFYGTYIVAAIVASLPSPHGLDVILTSALASSAGAIAGMITIGYGAKGTGNGTPFHLGRNWIVPTLGLATTLAFTLVLGPTR